MVYNSFVAINFIRYSIHRHKQNQKINLLQGHLFSNITKLMLFILDSQPYVLVNLCIIAGSIHLFRIRVRLTPEGINFKRKWIWYVLEIDLKEVRVTLNGNEV